MTRRRYVKLSMGLCEKICKKYNNTHVCGKDLKYYRDLNITKIKANSYAEAWERLKPARDCVGM